MSATNAQQQLQTLSDEYQRLQDDLQKTVRARQKLEAQQQENLGVQREFQNLKEDSNIYKLVGPVLLKQEKGEATLAVDARLEFIGKEIQRIEQHIKDIQGQSESKRMEIYELQTQLQGQQGDAQITK